jgi:translation initiation factor IF-1
MSKEDRIELEGIVEDSSNGKFVVGVSDDHKVSATISGKIRQSAIRILVGDRVVVEVSPYNLNMGRIVYRHKAGE